MAEMTDDEFLHYVESHSKILPAIFPKPMCIRLFKMAGLKDEAEEAEERITDAFVVLRYEKIDRILSQANEHRQKQSSQ